MSKKNDRKDETSDGIHLGTETQTQPRTNEDFGIVHRDDPSTNLFNDPTLPLSGVFAVRSQADNQQQYWSDLSMTDCGTEQITRQEFKDETDIDFILKRYNGTRGRVPMFEDNDMHLDLQTALQAKRYLDESNLRAPEELQDRYPTPAKIIEGIESGSYIKDIEKLQAEKSRIAELELIKKGTMTPPQNTPATPESTPKA